MRRILALACCGLCLGFSHVAGKAHVHESADHHAASRGLHLDHAHRSHGDHGDHRHGHDDHDGGGAGMAGLHVEHHEGDALYVSAPAVRSVGSNLRAMPALPFFGAPVDPPTTVSGCIDATSTRPRDPPRRSPTRTRAPPA